MEAIKLESIEFTLTKKVSYSLTPFGKFIIKDRNLNNRASSKSPKTLMLSLISFDEREGMPYSDDQYKTIVKFMKKNKTDILIEGYKFYTIMGDNLVEVHHNKLSLYYSFLNSHFLIDNDESWQKFEVNYKTL